MISQNDINYAFYGVLMISVKILNRIECRSRLYFWNHLLFLLLF